MSGINNQFQANVYGNNNIDNNIETASLENDSSVKKMPTSTTSVANHDNVRSMVNQSPNKRTVGVSVRERIAFFGKPAGGSVETQKNTPPPSRNNVSKRIAFFERAAEDSANTTPKGSAASSARATNNVPQIRSNGISWENQISKLQGQINNLQKQADVAKKQDPQPAWLGNFEKAVNNLKEAQEVLAKLKLAVPNQDLAVPGQELQNKLQIARFFLQSAQGQLNGTPVAAKA